MSSEAILKISVCFIDFVNGVIIFMSISLFNLFYLYLMQNYLLFILRVIAKDNIIDYKNNNKIKTAAIR